MHGASVGSDDHDYYAVYLEPPQTRLGLRSAEHHVWSTSDSTRKNTRDDIDLVMYSLAKFARLAAAGNPTILHFLFVENALVSIPGGTILPSGVAAFWPSRTCASSSATPMRNSIA